jgi:hypothetical protein
MLTCEYKFRVQLIFVASSRELNGAVMMQSPPFTLDHLFIFYETNQTVELQITLFQWSASHSKDARSQPSHSR